MAACVIQGYCPHCDEESRIYGGRFFKALIERDEERVAAAEREWYVRREADLRGCWPREEIPDTYMTHHANFALPELGYTHWWKMFNSRELLCHASIGDSISRVCADESVETRMACIAAAQQYLQNHADFCHYHVTRDGLAVVFANNNFRPRPAVGE